MDTKDKVAAIDGRFVHWVAPGYVGERFSLVWRGSFYTPFLHERRKLNLKLNLKSVFETIFFLITTSFLTV